MLQLPPLAPERPRPLVGALELGGATLAASLPVTSSGHRAFPEERPHLSRGVDFGLGPGMTQPGDAVEHDVRSIRAGGSAWVARIDANRHSVRSSQPEARGLDSAKLV